MAVAVTKVLQTGYERERNGDQMEKPVYLLLENGDYFEGKSFGAPLSEVTGEVVFTTGMTGYLETVSYTHLTLPTKA